MHLIARDITQLIEKRLKTNPVVAILGPRQCGKSTLAKEIIKLHGNSIYLDLEKRTDRDKLNDVWAFFQVNRGRLICLDEIQLVPEIFSQIRSYVDETAQSGQFLILGSASRDLIKQSSETLAGRIAYVEMKAFALSEIKDEFQTNELWLRGGFPRSLLSDDLEESYSWRENYIKTFLERDIPQLGFRIPSQILCQLWSMCAHIQGQLVNLSKLGTSLGVTHNTVKSYLNILEETFMVRLLYPYHENIKKRLVKSPKIYIRDSGIVHALLQIGDFNELLGHPVYGFSFEGMVIENLIHHYPKHMPYFYRTAKGDELDLILVKGQEKMAFEIKASTSPRVEDGFWRAIEDIKPTQVSIIAQVDSFYPYTNDIAVYNLADYIQKN